MGAEITADMFPPKSPPRQPLPMPGGPRASGGRGKGKGTSTNSPPPPVNHPVAHPHSQYCDTCGGNFQQKPNSPPRCNRCTDGMGWLANIKKRNAQAYQQLVSRLQ